MLRRIRIRIRRADTYICIYIDTYECIHDPGIIREIRISISREYTYIYIYTYEEQRKPELYEKSEYVFSDSIHK